MIKFFLVLNILALLGTLAIIVVLFIWTLQEEDMEKKRLRAGLVFAELGYVIFYFRE
jgi:hypothetical protein